MSRESILHELTHWGTANTANHGRDNLIRRAHTAGITKNKIHTLTGVSRPTIDKILKETPMQTPIIDTITPGPHPTDRLPLYDHDHRARTDMSTRTIPTNHLEVGDATVVTIDGMTRLAVIASPVTSRTRVPAPALTRLVVWHSEGVDMTTVEVEVPQGEWLVVRGQWARNRGSGTNPQFHVRTGPARTICGHALTVPQSLIGTPDAADRILTPVDTPKVDRWCHHCLTGLAIRAGHAHNA